LRPEPLAFFLHPGPTVTDSNGRRERSVLILEAAGVLGVSRRTVYYRIREGRLQTIRTRGGSQRVLWSSIEALLRSMRPALPAREPDPESTLAER
jgi:excisionase family DNA binding protein